MIRSKMHGMRQFRSKTKLLGFLRSWDRLLREPLRMLLLAVAFLKGFPQLRPPIILLRAFVKTL
jgi:hypothetical protein